jgi:putative transposase
MKTATMTRVPPVTAAIEEAWQAVGDCFGRFCLTAGVEALQAMCEDDVTDLCGEPHARSKERKGRRWGTTSGKIAFQGGLVDVERPRVRGLSGAEIPLPNWLAATSEDWLGRNAMNLMLLGVATRRYGRAVRIPGGPLARVNGDATSKSAVSRKFVAVSQQKLDDWLASDISKLDLLAIQIDGLHVADEIVLLGAIGIDASGEKHILGLVEGATENAAATQALLDSLIGRGLDPKVARLFILDGAKALSAAVKRTFGKLALIQRCQIHKGRNIAERCPKKHLAEVRQVLRDAWELDDAAEAARRIKDLAKKLAREAPGTAASLLEGLDELVTVCRLKLPKDLRRSLASTNAIENMQGTVRRVCRNVKRWRDASMALRWAAAGMQEAMSGFRRLKGYKHLPALKAALAEHQARLAIGGKPAETKVAADCATA